MAVINSSIKTGEFPEQWKEAIVVPILKKGDSKDTKNYRPVSCLPAASKVLEKVICDQLTIFVEVHGILPNNFASSTFFGYKRGLENNIRKQFIA